ncbi:hypothetical protein ACH4YO_18140 [Streptomyces noursei]|uniref:hypothetical protein n=1 Tax=Streptomyces noursei TaxID=1971 RepID=UPI0033E20FC5
MEEGAASGACDRKAPGNESAANDQAGAVRQNAEIVAEFQEFLVPVVSDLNQVRGAS